MVIKMRVYLDIVFFINFLFDLISVMSVNKILKRNIKFKRIIIGSLFGSISMITLFIRFNEIELICIKSLISIFIIIICFGIHDIKHFFTDLYYFYLLEIVIGGFMYLLKNNINNNLIIFIFLSILFIIYFIKNITNLKNNYNKYLNITLDINNKTYSFNAFIDTGNKLIDPILKLPVIIVNKDLLNINGDIYVPYKTINKESVLECVLGNNLCIDGKRINKKFLIGLSNNVSIDGVDCIFNEKLMEAI